MSASWRCLFEEVVVAYVLADLDELVSFAESQNLCQFSVVWSFVFFFEAELAGQHPDLYFAVAVEDLVEAKFLSSVFLEDFPFFDKINHFYVT